MKIAIQTLGCKVNQSESASIEALLRTSDYEIVDLKDNPDICIVNTCTVTAKSDYQSRQLIRRAARGGAKVIATGCYAQLKSDELTKIEGLNLIVGNDEKSKIVNHVKSVSGSSSSSTHVEVDDPVLPLSYQPYSSSRARAFLKIQDGCNFSCSYCTVPLARGKSRSMDREGVLKSIDNLVNSGYREIVLTGIHTGSYGSDLESKSSLLDMVTEIADTFKDVRLRLSSLEPQEFKDGFIDLIKEGRVCPHLHIPLQSGSDNILKVMNRGYTTDYYKQVINRIITDYPSISVGTDIIAGFPGETDNDFNNTVKFLDQLPLSYLHVFPYSKRPLTRAAHMSDQINEHVKKNRVKKLMEISERMKKDYISNIIGTTVNVIVENKTAINGLYSAISDNYLRILVKSTSLITGHSIKVKVISLTDKGLIATPLYLYK
jgi:threonylcarbamoyladenosine tRNA methylthiotransferase MtaB